MKNLPPFPTEYWQKFSDRPITVSAYDPRTAAVATACLKQLQQELTTYDQLAIYHRGSTAWQIAGKNDIELGVVSPAHIWKKVMADLTQLYGQPQNQEPEYARFNLMKHEYPIEIIVMGGYLAELDQKLHEYLQSHPELLRKYEECKYQFAYSSRVYHYQKDVFFRQVIAQIPD